MLSMLAKPGTYALPLVLLFACSHQEADNQRGLADAYLNPRFSEEFLEYWQIKDYGRYRKRIVQDYFLTKEDLSEIAYGETVDEILRFKRRLMTNWLEHELILRDMMRREFEDHRGEDGRYPAFVLCPVDDETMSTRLGTGMYDIYLKWAVQAERDQAVP
jgi:hypothetical protein